VDTSLTGKRLGTRDKNYKEASSEEEEDLYIVEDIVGHKFDPDTGALFYTVKWKDSSD